jgi:hypothetical protein
MSTNDVCCFNGISSHDAYNTFTTFYLFLLLLPIIPLLCIFIYIFVTNYFTSFIFVILIGYHLYTHLLMWRNIQPTWCVLGDTSLSPNPLSPRFGLLSSRLTPREAKGGRPYLTMLS